MKRLLTLSAALAVLTFCVGPVQAQQPVDQHYRIATSNFFGWCTAMAMDRLGILKEEADKVHVTFEFVWSDYVTSMTNFSTGDCDAVMVTSLDAIIMASDAGIPVTSVVDGDYSGGADIVYARVKTAAELDGQIIYLETNTVSHYEALEMARQLGIKPVIKQRAETEIVSTFINDPSEKATCSWLPHTLALADAGFYNVFNSSQIPFEIQDRTVFHSNLVKSDSAAVQAYVNAWFRTVAILRDGKGTVGGRTVTKQDVHAYMALAAGCDQSTLIRQDSLVKFYYDPTDAADFDGSKKNKEIHTKIRNFLYEQGRIGANEANAEFFGIRYPDGTVQGAEGNVILTFDDRFMRATAKQLGSAKKK